MELISAIFNSPYHMLLAIVVGDIAMAYLIIKYGIRFVRWFFRGFSKEDVA